MGTQFTSSFVNLYMGLFGEKGMFNGHLWSPNIILFKRYIDHLIFIWKGSIEDCLGFIRHLNNNEWGLPLTEPIHQSISVYHTTRTIDPHRVAS